MIMKRKMRKQKTEKQSDAGGDDRFVDLAKNPMFREMRKKEHKIQIDDRFKKMLVDKNFREDAFRLMDRRGRPTKNAGKDANLSHIYEHCHDEKFGSCESEVKQRKSSSNPETTESDSECDFDLMDGEDVQQIRLDLARGQGNVSSSSEDESTDGLLGRKAGENEEEGEEDGDNWGEFDKEVRRVEWASSRLAICNLDWSTVRAEDLMLLFNSQKPTDGKIHSVSVYLSDFGAECIEKEKRNGPMLKVRRPNRKRDEREEEEEKDLEERTKKAIRAHELDKLRYYYAVCACDSMDTATAIYEACDGVEYESSGLRFDIRFVPEEMEFETERIREQILSEQFSSDWYRPKKVGMHTLTASNPKISWETDDPERRRALKRAFDEEAKLEDFQAFIGSGTDDENDEERQRNAKREMLLAAAREVLDGENSHQNIDEEEGDGKQKMMDKKIKERGEKEYDGKDRELTDEESEEEVVEVRRPKQKTKFQLYLERKKQLKQERKQEEAKQRKQRKEMQTSPDNQKAPSTDVAQVEGDERFAEFFTNSSFAIDRTSANYKGGNLANRQAKEKQKRRQLKS